MQKIKNIKEIQNFGIFKNFNWDSNLSYQHKNNTEIYNFKDINIFYGRNYSGKTSLSKIIRSLEKQALPEKYENPDFKIELNDESLITQSTLSNFGHPIHVYNSDFLKENLKFLHNENENIESFSVALGDENQPILDRIQELKHELGTNEENTKTGTFLDIQNKANELKNATIEHGTKKRELDKLLTDKATKNSDSIKNQYSIFGEINYTITKLNQDIASVQDSTFNALTDDQIVENRTIITQKELDNPPEVSTYTLNFTSLIQSTTEILKTIVGGSKKIGELVNNNALNIWVQTGHQLHSDRTTCAFCNNEISENRREELRNHFDLETQNLRNRISKGIEHLTGLLNGENFKISFDVNHYYQQYHTNLFQLNIDLQAALDKQKSSIEQLKILLEQKNGKLFTELEVEYPDDHSDEIKAVLNKISQIRLDCIQLNSELTTKQKEAKNELRLNHVYQFIQNINYTKLKADIDTAFQAIEPLEHQLEALNTRKSLIESQIKEEEAKLKSEDEACKRINAILQHDFGHQCLSLEAIETDSINGKSFKFEIQRNQNGNKIKAHNLSEGEQSLIAFCYFLAKIQDDLDQNKEPILWIDDPISSLDNNHIFFIFSLIEDKIVSNQKFGQLFISTHNLEFLKYLKRLNGRKWGDIQFFIIKRNFNSSSIFQMPNYMKNYFSELNFLFQQLYLCANEENISDQNYNLFYNFPNNARKFLELYSNFHYPDGFSNTDTEKLKSLWGEHLAFTLTDRINNEYSHLSGIFERSFTPLEQPEMYKASFAILKKIVELNPKQYEGFLKSIGINSTTLDPLYIKLTT
ncbi:hypothetical protein F975_00384 [Acinetobacter sp. ANC 3789]|uniref:AAA family ATPase n=1 Tax=Acinetobacter sp. ANC 3789 TaxID=1217714 RepID=UPI0002D0AE25|nr:AAA family ATPase [Acinetobacter sp. ANC 3789]ENU81769.1 hypothetical protein F975_00384 [Acinetobacter sp. ANC 3789]